MKRFLMMCAIVTIAGTIIACETGQTKNSTVPVSSNVLVNKMNEQLAEVPVDGFGYKSSKVPAQKWDKWAKDAAPLVKEVLGKLPEGYVLQVTGHADTSGPEKPVGRKPGNIRLSTNRARAVYNSLKRQGITSPKLTYKGVGSSQTLPGVSGEDAQQRRVTFVIVEK